MKFRNNCKLTAPISKEEWKSLCHKTVVEFWYAKMIKEADTKSSLVWLNLQMIEPKKPHHLWPNYGCSSSLRQAASIRAKLISGSYILQSNRARFNQFKVNSSCPLCNFECEDVPHFFLECPMLEKARGNSVEHIKAMILKVEVTRPQDPIPPDNSTEWTYRILNSGHNEYCTCGQKKYSRSKECKSEHNCEAKHLNNTINLLCMRLHNEHMRLIGESSSSKTKKRGKSAKSTIKN